MEQVRWARGGLNTDDSVEILSPEDWSYAANIVDGRSYLGKNGEKENIKGTLASVNTSLWTNGLSQLIGVIRSAEDDVNYLFFYNPVADDNCILKITGTTATLVIRWPLLNFSPLKQYRINGGGVVGDLLYFTDNLNPPRCVHLTRYSSGIHPNNREEILHIKRGPQFPPEALPSVLGDQPLDSEMQFAYQYEYTDGQISVISPWTELFRVRNYDGYIFQPLTNVELRVGSNESIPSLVNRIRFIARKGNNGTPFYIGDNGPPFLPTIYGIDYVGQNLGVVPSNYLKNFELVPLTAKTECITKGRAWFGNFIEGYDTPSGFTINAVWEDHSSGFLEGPTFSPNSLFRMGVVFHDDQGRHAGVRDGEWTAVRPPTITRNQTRQRIRYSITGAPPSWAKYYSLVITKDLNKKFFLECWQVANTGSEPYVIISSSGVETYTMTFSGGVRYIRLDMQILNGTGTYYAFKEGDFVRITNETTGVNYGPLRVRKIVGTYVYVDAMDIGGPTGFTYNFQIYTPNIDSEPIFYEIGQRRATDGISLDSTDYFLTGDCVNFNVQTVGSNFYMAQMIRKPNDAAWDTDIGKPYVVTTLGQVNKQNFIRHSSPFIEGTNVNGLSEFASGDEGNVPAEAVQIQKLQPTMREASDGDVILAICNSDTYSIYMDEARMSTNDTSFIIKSTDVIGDVRKQRSGFGTLHPESVFEEMGQVFWYDQLARSYVRYASNGIFPISEYKLVTHFETQATLNDQDDIVMSGYDPFYKLAYVTFTNANNSTKKTIAFSIIKERWIGFYDFAPDGYFTGSNKMYSVVDGTVYTHNSESSFNNFYGTIYDSRIDYSFNDGPDVPKEWRVIQAQVSPNFYAFGAGAEQLLVADSLRVDIINRQGQAADIRTTEFDIDENMVYGVIRGDINSTGGIVNGDSIYSNTIQVRVIFSGGPYKQIIAMKAGCDPSRGHNL